MLPLRDNIPAKRLCIVNTALIGINVAAFLYQWSSPQRLDHLIAYYSLIPARLTNHEIATHFAIWEQLLPLCTYMFLHGGWMHLLGNIWTLWIFGDNVEDYLGHFRYLCFYLLAGVTAAAVHVLTAPRSPVPTIGASGAIAGVMGAYFVLYPRARILTLVPLLFFFPLIEVPAFFVLGLWFLLQFYNGMFGLLSGVHGFGGVAWWAHAGGFVGGIIILRLMAKRK